MRFTDIFRTLFLCMFITAAAACGKEGDPAEQEQVENNVNIILSVDKTSLETADIRVRHDGQNDLKWVYISTSDLESDADELIDSAIDNELSLTGQLLAEYGNNRSLRISGLAPKTYYRLIVKFVDGEGRPVGKATDLLFRTNRNLDVFEENRNWNVMYDARTQGFYSGTAELMEFDNFKCTSSDDEPYILAVIKKNDYESFVKNPEHKLKIRTFFEEYLASSGVASGSKEWKDIIETGDCTRMNPGEYNETKDVAKATADDLAGCIIGPENFIICMPNEPHKPNIAVSEDVVLKKAVCKVHI